MITTATRPTITDPAARTALATGRAPDARGYVPATRCPYRSAVLLEAAGLARIVRESDTAHGARYIGVRLTVDALGGTQ